MTETQKKLLDKFNEEVKDMDYYITIADEERNSEMCDYHLVKGLYAISKDEYTHAKFLHDYLVDSGINLTADQEAKWYAMEEKMVRKLRRF